MQAAQIIALSVSLAHVALLAGIYISLGGAPSQIFVSEVLDTRTFFKGLLTVIVVLEIAIAAAYIFLSRPPLTALPWGLLAGLATLTSLASWITVVCTQMGYPSHFTGTAVFVIASSVYSCFLIARAPRHRYIYACLLAGTLACAAAFVVVHLRQDYGSSSVLEWVTFLLQGTMLAIYYYETPIIISGENEGHSGGTKPRVRAVAAQQQQQAEAAMPLLLLVNGSPASRQHQQQLVAAGRPLRGGGGLGAVREEYADGDEEEGGWGARW